jgi:serine/threonine-protein kinase RsbW
VFDETKAVRIHIFAETEVESTASLSFVELRTSIASRVDIVSPFIEQVMSFISRAVADRNNFDVELALREALVNAIVHGNQEAPDRRVYVSCRCMPDGEVSITIQDEGRGFEYDAVPDPTSSDNQLRTHGRGIYLMRTLMDQVDFEQGGSVVHMHKRANAASDPTRKSQ